MDLFTPESDRDKIVDTKNKLGSWGYYLNDDVVLNLIKTLSVVHQERQKHIIYPPASDVFNAYNYTHIKNVKVVIIGQDPYADGNAVGLSFGVRKTITQSLIKIFECIKKDYPEKEMEGLSDATLHYLTVQGVLLLNTCLTVRQNHPLSHSKIKWQDFVQATIKVLNDNKNNVVWMLWGNEAKKFCEPYIKNKTHLVLETEHPAYAAKQNRDWKCDHFVKANEFLSKTNQRQIVWR